MFSYEDTTFVCCTRTLVSYNWYICTKCILFMLFIHTSFVHQVQKKYNSKLESVNVYHVYWHEIFILNSLSLMSMNLAKIGVKRHKINRNIYCTVHLNRCLWHRECWMWKIKKWTLTWLINIYTYRRRILLLYTYKYKLYQWRITNV